MKLDEIPEEVLDALENRDHSEEAIEQMSPKQMFIEYCEWEGLINYGSDLWDLMDELKSLEGK